MLPSGRAGKVRANRLVSFIFVVLELSMDGKLIPEIGNGCVRLGFTALITYSLQVLFYIARLVRSGGLVWMNGEKKSQ
jgi:hypothetical protein